MPPQDGYLFRSGFEPDVYINDSYTQIMGSDGMDWVDDLQAIPHVDWFYMNLGEATVPDDVTVDLREDPDDPANRVLFFQHLHSPSASSRTQASLMFETAGDHLFEQGYVRYCMRLHDNIAHLEQYPDMIDWFMLMEWWEMDSNARWSLHLYKDSGVGNPLYWGVIGQTHTPNYEPIWPAQTNTEVEVPIGEWFRFEAFFKKGTDSTGRIWIAITREGQDTQVLFDINDYTEHPVTPLPIANWQVFKMYTSQTMVDFMRDAGRPVAVYYNDFEYWADIP